MSSQCVSELLSGCWRCSITYVMFSAGNVSVLAILEMQLTLGSENNLIVPSCKDGLQSALLKCASVRQADVWG